MGFDFSNGIDNLFGGSSDVFGNTGLVSGLLSGLDSSFGGSSQPVSVSYAAQPMPVSSASVPMVARAAAAGIARWSVSFPSLWQALQKYRASGVHMSIAKLWSMFRRVGPTVLATYIGAAAVSDLVTYKATHKVRRMNPANSRALSRSLRRLKSFERLSTRVSAQLSRSASRGRGRSRSRCRTCRSVPCKC